MKHTLRNTSILLYLSITAISLHGQEKPLVKPDVKVVLDQAERQSEFYTETFKNLLADETKTFEVFKKDGSVKKKRTVLSNFLVYPLTKKPDRIIEFRNVLAVDGKKLDGTDKRAEEFFTKVVGAESSDAEIKNLQKESLRYDEEILISGMTLFQSLALDTKLRPFFTYELANVQLPNGTAGYSVAYSQTRETADISVNSTSESEADRGQQYEIDVDSEVPLNARLSGVINIDAATFQVVSETRVLTIQPIGFEKPLTVIEDKFEFKPSPFGILTPAKITHSQYRAKIKERKAIKDVTVTFEYGNFTRPDVDVKSSDVK